MIDLCIVTEGSCQKADTPDTPDTPTPCKYPPPHPRQPPRRRLLRREEIPHHHSRRRPHARSSYHQRNERSGLFDRNRGPRRPTTQFEVFWTLDCSPPYSALMAVLGSH